MTGTDVPPPKAPARPAPGPAAVALILVGILFYLWKERGELNAERVGTRAKLQEIETMQTRMAQLQSESESLKKDMQEIEVMIPEDDPNVVLVMKDLAALIGAHEAKDFSFRLGDGEARTAARRGQGGRSAPGGVGGQGDDSGETALKKSFIRIHLEASFVELVDILNDILNMERIVSVESLKIQRVEDRLAKQDVELLVVFYSF